jgi:flagellin
VQDELNQLQSQLSSIGDASVFSGENWLSVDSGVTGYNATKSVVASFTRTGGSVSIGTISIDTAAIKLFDADATAVGIIDGQRDATGAIGTGGTFSVSDLDISALTDSAADLVTLEEYIVGVDTAFGEITDAAANLGAVKSRIDLQKGFVSSLMGAIERGLGQLVDADMNEESTKLQALQVQAQLGVQALSIANQSSQNILSLFR